MTKLDPAGEPSMDEILASIRRIIAEDPPGSRAQPEPPAAPRKDPVPHPQTELPGAREADGLAPRGEPPIGSSVFGPSLFAAAPQRQSDPLPRLSPTGKREVEAIPLGGTQPGIDTRLAEVLGSVRSVMSDSGRTEPTFAALPPEPATEATPATNVQAAIDSLISPKPEARETQAAGLPTRPGFTVSRDGFIPPAGKPVPAPAADPFEFSLGPSPFARQSELAPAPEAAAPAPPAPTTEAFGSLIPSRDVLSIDRSGQSEPVKPSEPSGSPASFTASYAPAASSQPDFSAMSFSRAPAVETPFAGRETREPMFAPDATFPAAPAAAPAASAFVPAAAAPQPAPVMEPAHTAAGTRPATRTSPSFGELATPHVDIPAWPPASEPKPAASAFAPPPAAAAAPAPQVAAPPVMAAPAPAFTATMFEAPASAAAPQSAAAPAAMAAPAAPPAAPYAPAVPPAHTQARVKEATAAPAAPVAAQPDPAAALLEQLARTSTSAAPPQTAPIAQAVVAPTPAPAAAPIAAGRDEAVVEHVEATIEPAAAAAVPDEQDADFEDAQEVDAEAEPTIEPATPGHPAASASAAATAAQALVARSSQETPQNSSTAVAPASDNGAGVRTMEDTVADLLRPMLRSWLSENMPRIVERALRKELEESNRSEHKSAAE